MEPQDEIFGPILEMNDEVFEDMFENKPLERAAVSSQKTFKKSKLSKIRTSFSPFEKKRPSVERTNISTNPNVMRKQKPSEVDDIKTFRNLLTSTSFAFLDSGYKYQYDKFNDVFRYVPLNGDIF